MALTIGEIEAVAAKGWQATDAEPLGEWLLRAAAGFTGRANSALSVGDPGMPLPEAEAMVRRWYAARNLPATVAVPYPLGRPGDSPTDRFLSEQGWRVRPGPAIVMTARAADVVRAGPAEKVDIDPEPDQAWLDLYRSGEKLPPIARQLMLSAPFQAFASIRRQADTVAIGRVAVADGWAGLTAVEVHPGHRRQGLATAITTALADVSVSHGAVHLYLQVVDDNEAAHALYARAGFTDHHGYHYRLAPPT
jgi:ribosomal protein S18 acetylase RimI-like enzyme